MSEMTREISEAVQNVYEYIDGLCKRLGEDIDRLGKAIDQRVSWRTFIVVGSLVIAVMVGVATILYTQVQETQAKIQAQAILYENRLTVLETNYRNIVNILEEIRQDIKKIRNV